MIAVAPEATGDPPYHHGDLRRGLLGAARAMLAHGDAETISLRELARRVEVSPRAPYRHFASKDALMSALATEGFEALKAELAAAAGDASPGSELMAQALAYVRFALHDPAMFRLMFSYRMQDANETLRAAKQATKTLLAERVAADPRFGDDVQARALGCWALVHGLAILILDGLAFEEYPLDESEMVKRVAKTMLQLP